MLYGNEWGCFFGVYPLHSTRILVHSILPGRIKSCASPQPTLVILSNMRRGCEQFAHRGLCPGVAQHRVAFQPQRLMNGSPHFNRHPPATSPHALYRLFSPFLLAMDSSGSSSDCIITPNPDLIGIGVSYILMLPKLPLTCDRSASPSTVSPSLDPSSPSYSAPLGLPRQSILFSA